jgi:hypothetical protein
MATIRRRGLKWEAQIRRKGHRTISRSFETKTDAKIWARQIEVGLELGNLELPERSKAEIKLGDLVERYLDKITKDKRGREPEEYRLRQFLSHPICSKRVSGLKTEDFAAYRDQRLRQVAPSSVKRVHDATLEMFRTNRDQVCREKMFGGAQERDALPF